MKSKKWIIIILVLAFIYPCNICRAAQEAGATTGSNTGTSTKKGSSSGSSQDQKKASNEEVTPDTWLDQSFTAAKEFLEQKETKDDLGWANPVLDIFRKLVNTANRVLLVALFGVSTVSLSIIGVRFMTSGASPAERQKAQRSLKTTFIAMAYGFGAFTIWRVAMAIINFIIKHMADGTGTT